MAQKPVMRAELFVRALRACQNVKGARVWAAASRGRKDLDRYCSFLLWWPLAQFFPRVWLTRFPGQKSKPSGDARTITITPGSRSNNNGNPKFIPDQ